jgi:DNA polymerase III subunit delta'
MSSILSKVQGHEKNILKLSKAIVQSKLPHALLMTGPDSIGKKLVSMGLAQTILCEQRNSVDPYACGQCPSCIRVEKNQSENLLFIEPDGSQIKIDQTRRILDFLSLSNFNRSRVIIIDQCHLMNPQAANALLKILEEPTDQVFFFLITTSKETLLQTLQSRTQNICFFNLTSAQLKLIKPGLSDWMYTSSQGRVKSLMDMSDSSLSADRKKHVQLLHRFLEIDFLLDQNWRAEFKGREEARAIVKSWTSFLRDYLFLKINPEQDVINSDLLVELRHIKIEQNSKIFFLLTSFIHFEKDLLGFLDPVLLIEKIKVNYAA